MVRILIDRALVSENEEPLEGPPEEPLKVKAGTVLDVLKQVFRSRPVLAGVLVDPTEGRYRAVIHLNGEDVRFLDYLETKVNGGDEIRLVPFEEAGVVEHTYYLTFGPDKVKEPLLHRLGRMFQVEVNILGARVTARKGFVHASFAGASGEVDGAVRWLRGNDVGIDEAD